MYIFVSAKKTIVQNQDSFIVVNVVYGNFAIFIEKPLTEQSEISETCLIGYFYIRDFRILQNKSNPIIWFNIFKLKNVNQN